MRQYIRNHPEHRTHQNQKRNNRRRIITDQRKNKNRHTDKHNPKPRNPMLIRLRKNPRHHIHLRHTLANTRQPIHRRILRTHNRKSSHQSHPDLTHTAKKIFPIKQMRRRRIHQLLPWSIIMKPKHHDRLHTTDQRKTNDHTKRNIPLRILNTLGNRNHILRPDKQPECCSRSRKQLRRLRSHSIRLRNHLSRTQLKHTDQSHNDHRTNQKKRNQILDLGKHIHATKVRDHDHDRHYQRIRNAGNR